MIEFEPIDKWQIVSEAKDQWRLNGKALEMQVQAGNMWGAGFGERNNIFVLPKKEESYSVSVKVTIDPQHPYEQAGVGIFWDTNNYIKVTREQYHGEQQLLFCREENGQPKIEQRVDYTSTQVEFKLEKKPTGVTSYYRANDEQSWQKIHTVPIIAGEERGVMLSTFGGDAQNRRWATFENMSLEDM